MSFTQKYLKRITYCDYAKLKVVIVLHSVDVCIFFIIPAVLCVIFFIRIFSVLKNMLSHRERNQQLNRALAVSYFAWILLWTPNIMFDVVTSFKYIRWFNRFEESTDWMDKNFKFFNNLTDSIGLLYSTLIPLIFIVLMPTLQEPGKKLLQRLKQRCG